MTHFRRPPSFSSRSIVLSTALLLLSAASLSVAAFPGLWSGAVDLFGSASGLAAPGTGNEVRRRPIAPGLNDDSGVLVQQYFAGDGSALTASKWGSSPGGPFTSAFVAGSAANFATVNGTGTGGSIAVGGLNAIENFTITVASGTISNQGNVVVPVTVAAGKTLDFSTNSFTASATAGYNFTGPGTFALAGNTYGGGFTINSGRLVARGINAMGGAAGNTLTINGGTIAGSANRDFTGKFGGGITVGGNLQLGSATAPASGGASLTFSNNVSLGAATRTLTIGADGLYTFSGVISGAAGTGLTIANAPGATGAIVLSGVNTYTGNTTITGGSLSMSGAGSIASSAVIDIGGTGIFDVQGLTTALTLANGQALRGSGTTATGTVATSAAKGLTTAANSPLQFTAFNGSTAPLTVSGAGTLALQAGNPVTVTIANGGTPLGTGDYKLISKGATGTVTGLPTSLTVNGDGVSGTSSLVLTAGELYLRVAAAPEMNVQGNAIDIADGDTTPAATDHTDFGSININGGTQGRTFTIQNTGTADLLLSGIPNKVIIGGTNAADFAVLAPPPTSPVAPAGSTTFQILFDPSAAGPRSATISIPNNDSNENPYDFAIAGFGTGPLAGTVNVGAGQAFTSLTRDEAGGLFKALNAGGLSGDLTVNITSDLTSENAAVTLNELAETGVGGYTVTIKPSGAARAISGTGGVNGMIRLTGADRVTIDGSLAGGTDRSLTITNNGANGAVIGMSGTGGTVPGPSFNTVKNTNLRGASPFDGSRGILMANSDAASNSIINNSIERVRFGITLQSVGSGHVISSNTIGPAVMGNDRIGNIGITATLVSNLSITGNEIRNVGNLATDADPGLNGAIGITTVSAFDWSKGTPATGAVTNVTIERNNVHNLITENGQSSAGIWIGSTGSNSNNKVINNFVYSIKSNGNVDADEGAGIVINDGDGDLIANNSVFLFGEIASASIPAANASTWGIVMDSLSVTNLSILNNISYVSVFSSGNATLRHGAIRIPTAAISTNNAILNFNDLFAPGNFVGKFGASNISTSTDLPSWQTASGQEGSSYSVDPLFVSATDLHVQNTSPVSGQATPLAAVTNDFDGEARSAATPDTGADEFTSVSTAPEINVTGNATSIIDGDTTPSAGDHTDFGSTAVTGGTIVRTFTIQNLGTATLNLTGSPIVSVTGSNPGDFVVTTQPASASVAPSGSVTFQVTFDPTNVGVRSARINIQTNDLNENPYNFDIQGTGTTPEINVQGNGVSIASGDTTPSLADNTDYGTVPLYTNFERVFTIQNLGTANLTPTNVSITGANASEFRVVSGAGGTVLAGGSRPFTVRFTPLALGVRSATVSIANNDPDENPYTFAIQGTGGPAVPGTFTVLKTADTNDGVCDADCSLREAITAANASSDATTINFNIPSSIQSISATLGDQPTITQPVFIDGLSQPGASVGFPSVEINGGSACLNVQSAGVTIRGVTINRCGSGILVTNGGSAVIQSNMIGTVPTGDPSSFGNTRGIAIANGSAIIGTNSDGINDADERNIIVQNIGGGILVASPTGGTRIMGNFFGVQPFGSIDEGNGGVAAVEILGSPNNIIGTDGDGLNDAGEANLFRFNSDGVRITGSTAVGNTVRGNVFRDNIGHPINLASDGRTANDAGDPDTGPNGLQNFPVITSAAGGATPSINGTLNSTPGQPFRIDFYASADCALNGAGQDATTHLGSVVTGVTNGSGDVTFNFVPTSLSIGTIIAATATSADGSTSEVSACFTATAPAPEMNVAGNGQNITDGDTTPSRDDHTDFGSIVVGAGSISRTFTVQNTGSAALNLTSDPRISITGPHAANFSVATDATTPVAAGGSTTFTISFTPNSANNFFATIVIANDDADENPYTFNIQGTGIANPSFRSAATGNWNSIATWEQSNDGGASWIAATTTPTSANSDSIVVRSGHTVTSTADLTIDQTTIDSGGTVLTNSGTQFVIADGAGADLTTNGTITASGTVRAGGNIQNNSAISMTALVILDNASFTGAGTYAYTGSAVIAFQNTGGVFNVNAPAPYWPTTNGPNHFQVLMGSAGVSLNVPRSVPTQAFVAASLQNAGNLTVDGELRLQSFGSVSGSPTYSPGSTLNYLIFSASYGRGDEWLPNVTTGPGYPRNVSISFGTLDLANGATTQPFQIGGNLSTASGTQLRMAGTTPMQAPLRVLGNVSNSGTLELSTLAGGDLFVGGDWTNAATFINNGRTVTFNGTGPQTITTFGTGAGKAFASLVFNKSSGTATLAGPINASSIEVQAGTFDTSAASSFAVTTSGAFTIGATGTFNENDSTVTVGGNWNNSGTFNAGTGSVNNFNGAGGQSFTGSTTFRNISITTTTPRTITFAAGATQAATGSLAMTGTAGNLLSLRSSTGGSQWNLIAPATQTVDFVDVQDSNATGGQLVNQTNSVNSGSNLNWNFPGAGPEMNVTGNSINIPDGDTTPTTADGTDFGSVLVGGNTVRQFTIQNTGTINLSLTGMPLVAVSGANAAEFVVTAQPTTPVPAGGGTVTFNVTFTPAAHGTRTASISIANNDADENPYTFDIVGTGTTVGTLVVDTLIDSGALNACTAAPGDCSLRGANSAAANGATIVFDPGVFARNALGAQTIVLGSEIVIGSDITITGPGALQLTISGGDATRIFKIQANLSLSGVTLSNGNAAGNGGALEIGGGATVTLSSIIASGNNATAFGGAVAASPGATLTISGSALSMNGADGSGGAISCSSCQLSITGSTVAQNASVGNGGGVWGSVPGASVTITDSTFSQNATQINGGGVFIGDATSASISGSTFNGNSAALFGGGLYTEINSLVTNSTFSANSAASGGGGIHVQNGSPVFTHVTITRNRSSFPGGGVNRAGGTPRFRNSIVAGNTDSAGTTPNDINGTVDAASSFNLIGTGGSGGLINGVNFNLVGVADPQLAGLANNGGPTMTHKPFVGFPGHDKGNSFGVVTDQRGVARPIDWPNVPNSLADAGELGTVGDGADIGTVELLIPTAANASLTGRVVTADGAGIRNAVVTIAGGGLAEPRQIQTSSFGYYRFDDLPVGGTFVVTVGSKRFVFSKPSVTITVLDSVEGINFVAEPLE